MELLNRKNQTLSSKPPVKVVQFGEGNFLRAFVEYGIQVLNKTLGFNAGVAVVQPIERGTVQMINDQDGLYTLFTRGVVAGKEIEEQHLIDTIVKAVNPYEDFHAFKALAREEELEFIISNTTEAGIAFDPQDRPEMEPPNTFPAKLAVLLYERYHYFSGDADKGLAIIPCELINHNADTLKSILLKYADLWEWEEDFKQWLQEANSFHNTLVDRIVPGYPKDEIEIYEQRLKYKDQLIVAAEVFFLWVIEGDDTLRRKLPFHKTDLDVKFVPDMQPYRTRKVRILNGAHTSMVPISLLYGNETVKETVDDTFTGDFVSETIFDEIIPTLDLNQRELEEFARAVLDRFRNPFIKHQLASIALNSISKFKVRVMPSLLRYHELKNRWPPRLVYAFACLLRFYKGNYQDRSLPVQDDATIVDYFAKLWEREDLDGLVAEVLTKEDYWGEDLTKREGFVDVVTNALEALEGSGVEQGFLQSARKMSVG